MMTGMSQQFVIRSIPHPSRPFLGTSRCFYSTARSTNSINRQSCRILCQQGQNPGTKGGLRVLEWTGGLLPQGQLVKTAKFGWQTVWLTFMRELAPQSSDGMYKRPSYSFQHRIGDADFPAQPGRYFLYLGNPCPWCHRVAMAVALRGLGDMVTVVKAIDDPERASRGGWVFNTPEPGFNAKDLREVYDACTPGGYRGRCTAPVLVDAKTKRIVCNESAAILRNLNEAAFPGAGWIDLCPEELKSEIDSFNERTYESVNNGVYKSGFATTQAAYESAQRALWNELAALDAELAHRRFLCGDKFTEADLRLFPTAVRFDAVYTVLFKCSAKRWSDFPNLQAWLLDCAGLPLPGSTGATLADTVDVDDCRKSYFKQLFPLNPGGIIPTGPTAVELGLAGGQAAEKESSRGPRDAPHVYYRKLGQ